MDAMRRSRQRLALLGRLTAAALVARPPVGRARAGWTLVLVGLLAGALLPSAFAAESEPAALAAAATRPDARAATVGSTTWYFAEGYTGPGFDEYLTINNPAATADQATINYFVEGASSPTVRTVPLAASSRTTVVVHGDLDATTNPGGLGRLMVGHATQVTTTGPVVIERPMYFTYGAGITGGHIVLGATDLDYIWSFAEGYTGAGFDEYLTIQNPGATAGLATITYFVEGAASPTVRPVNLPAQSRTTVPVHVAYDAANNPGGLGRLSVGHSTRIVTTVPTVAERPMYFTYGNGITGGHDVMGAPGRNISCSVALNGASESPANASAGSGALRLNFNPDNGRIRGDWMLSGLGATTGAHIHEAAVGANGPIRVDFGPRPAGGNAFATNTLSTPQQVAAILANPVGFYVNVHTAAYPAGEVRGQLDCTQPGLTWLFAEGYTGAGFDEYLTILNPGPSAGTATIAYVVEGAANPTVRPVSLPAGSRTTVAVHGDFDATTNPGGLGRLTVGHATRIVTTVPTIVERPIYFSYGSSIASGRAALDGLSRAASPITDGHDVMGAPGQVAICLATLTGAGEFPPNPSAGNGLVYLRFNVATGDVRAQWLLGGLTDISAAHIHQGPAGTNGPVRVDFGMLPAAGGAFFTPTTTTSTQAHAIAANPSNFYVNVHTAAYPSGELRGQITCAPAAGMRWSFAEGYTGTGFDEYLTIFNPNPTGTSVDLAYLVEGSSNPTKRTVALAGGSRTTVAVSAAFDATTNPGGLGRLPVGHATQASSTQPVVIERPMYFMYNTTVDGGHDVMGATNRAGSVCSAMLTGGAEVPPNASAGRGTVQLAIDPQTGVIQGDWLIRGLTGISAAHIHGAAFGVNGPIRVHFSGLPATGGAFATTDTSTPDQVTAIENNPANFYVNVHTAAYPNGELRGQLVCIP